MTATLLALALLAAPKKSPAPPRGVLIAVMDYAIREGDEVQLFCCDARGRLLDIAVAEDYRAYCDLQKAITAGDPEGLRELFRAKSANLLPSGTRVRVIEFATPSLRYKPDPGCRGVEVRILDGPMKGKTCYALDDYVRLCRTVIPKAKKSRR